MRSFQAGLTEVQVTCGGKISIEQGTCHGILYIYVIYHYFKLYMLYFYVIYDYTILTISIVYIYIFIHLKKI